MTINGRGVGLRKKGMDKGKGKGRKVGIKTEGGEDDALTGEGGGRWWLCFLIDVEDEMSARGIGEG